MATRVRIVGLENLSKRIKTQVGRAIKQSGFEQILLKELIEEIKTRRIRPELRAATIKRRGQLATTNPTGKAYSQGKSNLTFTGQLLASLRSKFRVRGLVFNFTAIGRHKPYKNLSGKKQKFKRKLNEDTGKLVSGAPRNSDIFKGQEELYGRSLANMFLLNTFRGRIVNKLKQSIKKFLTN